MKTTPMIPLLAIFFGVFGWINPLDAKETNTFKLSIEKPGDKKLSVLKCGKTEKPLLSESDVAYDLVINQPVTSINHNLSHKIDYKFFKCEKDTWLETSAPVGFVIDYRLVVAQGGFWNSGSLPKQEAIKYVLKIIPNQKNYFMSLGKLMDDEQKEDYRAAFKTTLRLKYFLAKVDSVGEEVNLAKVGSFYLGKYSLHIEAEINTGDVESDIDPANAYYCGEVIAPEGLMKAKDATKEGEGVWYYRAQDIMIENIGDRLRVQYKLLATICKQREIDKKYYWENVAFDSSIRSFIGPFHGYFGSEFWNNGSADDIMSNIERYVGVSNKSFGILEPHDVSPVNVIREIDVKELLDEKTYKDFYLAEKVTPVQMSLGIRSNYTVIPGQFGKVNGVLDFVAYPFFKTDFFLKKGQKDVLRPTPRNNDGTIPGMNAGLNVVKLWVADKIELKVSKPNTDEAWDQCGLTLLQSPDSKLFKLQLSLLHTREDRLVFYKPIGFGIYETDNGKVNVSNLSSFAKDGNAAHGPWNRYSDSSLMMSRSFDLKDDQTGIHRMDIKTDRSLEAVLSLEYRFAETAVNGESGSIITDWVLCKDFKLSEPNMNEIKKMRIVK